MAFSVQHAKYPPYMAKESAVCPSSLLTLLRFNVANPRTGFQALQVFTSTRIFVSYFVLLFVLLLPFGHAYMWVCVCVYLLCAAVHWNGTGRGVGVGVGIATVLMASGTQHFYCLQRTLRIRNVCRFSMPFVAVVVVALPLCLAVCLLTWHSPWAPSAAKAKQTNSKKQKQKQKKSFQFYFTHFRIFMACHLFAYAFANSCAFHYQSVRACQWAWAWACA